jgi:serine phosphatase RsbU (regulator of sigma subunit)/Tfp pilus assembly protein PilF
LSQYSSEIKIKIDSLNKEIKTSQVDSLTVKALIALDQIIYLADPELDYQLNIRIDSLSKLNIGHGLSKSEEKSFLIASGFSLRNLGIIYKKRGDLSKSLESYTSSLEINKELGDSNGVANSYNGIGNIYLDQGNYAMAIVYYTKSLIINEKSNNIKGAANNYINIGTIKRNQRNLDDAIMYYSKALKLYSQIKADRGIAGALNQLSGVYTDQGKYSLALKSISESYNIFKNTSNQTGMAEALISKGRIYLKTGNYNKALETLKNAMLVSEKIKDNNAICKSLVNIASVHLKLGNLELSKEYGNRSMNLAQEIGSKLRVYEASKVLWEVNKKMGDSDSALKMYELFISIKDSLDGEENKKAVIQQEFKYKYEKQIVADSIKSIEKNKIKDALLIAEKAENKQYLLEAKQQKLIKYILYTGLLFALIFGGFIYNRFRVTNKQNIIIQVQKEKVEEKNKEILDSINYAKRIQTAILPTSKVIKQYLPSSFILYKPKDVVAGDFYWLEHKDGKVLFAAADCTGHGVPGAMVSVVCNNGLNRSVREYGLSDPGLILDKTRQIVIEEFEKSEEDVKDGMDIALCSLSNNTLKYAGANNPLWIIRNGEVIETKANRQPIGISDIQKPFITHVFELKKGDTIYMFSDGYVDQFGGEKGKKFKVKALRTLLLSIQDKPMEEQKLLIDSTFEIWKGELEQIDDICVIGVRV